MKFTYDNVVIAAMANAMPQERWSSEAIEARLDNVYERLKLPRGRLELMTGIRERRFWPADMPPSKAAAAAGRKALDKGAVPLGSIDLLINASVCRDRMEPATASFVHGLLELDSSTQVLDISNACLGFCNALVLAGAMIAAGQIKSALIVSGENGRPLMDWTLNELQQPHQTRKSVKPYFANLTIGAGAVAALVCHEKQLQSDCQPVARLVSGVSLTDSAANKLCQGGSAGAHALEMQTDSEALLEAGVKLAATTWQAFLEHTGMTVAAFRRVVCHQVGKQHQRALLEALGIPLDKDFPTYPDYGNIGSVSLPFTLAEAVTSGVVSRGDHVAGLGIGSGLCCMMLNFAVL